MLLRNLNTADQTGALLQEMSEGLPTISAFARLCGHALAGEIQAVTVSQEALTLVAACGDQGTFDIRGDKDGFESAERFLAVCVEVGPSRRLLFRDKSNPRQTMLYLEGFRQLCQSGFIMHHMMKDFSLSKTGYELAETLEVTDFQKWIDFAVEIEH